MSPNKDKEKLEAIRQIGEAISSDLILKDILGLIVQVTAKMMNTNICSLMLIDEKKKELVLRATQSIDEAYNNKPNIKLGEGIAGKVAEENKPRQVIDVTKDPLYKNKEIAKKCGLKSLLCVPLRAHGKVIGVINNYTKEQHEFSKSEIDTLIAISSQAGLVISNSNLQEQVDKTKEELQSRKIIEKAKWILVKQQNISEDKAFKLMQKESMDKRKPIKEIAEAVILVDEMRKKN
ncbi:MAG: ANTAR domain-containing protein [Candidatus Margulisbacteria bacterium]|nr:ANTAR domain-containing protein [Candidatus Margulisiibacteriota bacterium]